jgi:hypothetical protein
VCFTPGTPKRLRLEVWNNWRMPQMFWADVRLWLPEGVTCPGGTKFVLPLQYLHEEKGVAEFALDTTGFAGHELELMIDIRLRDRSTQGSIPVLLLRAVCPSPRGTPPPSGGR